MVKVKHINMEVVLSKYTLFIILFLCSCKAVSSNNQLINKTIKETLYMVNENNSIGVVNMLGTENPGIDTSSIKYDVKYMYYILTKYLNNNIEHLEWSTDGTIDNLGRTKFIIPLYKGFDSLTGCKYVVLNLYLGPEEIISLDKLSGFEPEIEVDSDYRSKLREGGNLLDIDKILEGINKER